MGKRDGFDNADTGLDQNSVHSPGHSPDLHASGGAGLSTDAETDAHAGADEVMDSPETAPSGQRRASGRIRVSGVRVSKGVVIDASSGGMRIKGKTPKGCSPGSVISLEVAGDDGAITVDCEVRWIQRHPLRGATFGVSFVELSDEDRRELFGIIRRSGTETRCRWMAA